MQLLIPTMMVYGGNMTRAALGFVISMLVARVLGPEQFGVFALFTAVLVLAHNICGEGLDAAVVRFYANSVPLQPARARQVLSHSLIVRLGLCIAIVSLGWLLSSWVASTLLHDSHLTEPLRLGLLGAMSASLCTFALAGLQAQQRFTAYAFLAPMVNALRFAMVPVLLAFGLFTLPWIMGTQVVLFFAGAAAGMWLLRDALRLSVPDSGLLKEIIAFSKWTALAKLCFLLIWALGVPTLNALGNAHEAGVFSAGMTLLMAVDQITVAILTVRAPAVNRITDTDDFRKYVRQSVQSSLRMAMPLCLMLVAAKPIVLGVYGVQYEHSAPVVQILLAGFLATLLTHPLYLVFYAMNRPGLHAATGAVALVVWAIAAWLLIPAYGSLGAAGAVCAARLTEALLIAALLWLVLRRKFDPARAGS